MLCNGRSSSNTWGIPKEFPRETESNYYIKGIKDKNGGMQYEYIDCPIYQKIEDYLYNIRKFNGKFQDFIIAEAGVGKSYEMKMAIWKLKENAKKRKGQTVYSYYCDLRQYTSTMLDRIEPSEPSEPFYYFLDGYDELSYEQQNEILKIMNQKKPYCHSTFLLLLQDIIV